jgi:uncharacterized protein YecT (DUF1311 family)
VNGHAGMRCETPEAAGQSIARGITDGSGVFCIALRRESGENGKPIMRKSIFLCLAAAALPLALFAQSGVTDPQTLKVCSEVKETPFPASDRPSPEEAKELASCKSDDMYFGFAGRPDFENARKCAYVEMDEGNTHQPFGGKTILMMLYANGRGVARNYDLAMKLACEIPGAPGDVAGTVHELLRYKESKWQGNNFSICEHSGGRYMYGQCALLDYRFEHAEREKKLDEMAAGLAPAQKKAFQELRRAAAAFFKVQAAKGQDLTGTFEIQEVGFQERTMLAGLKQLDEGDLPKFTHGDAAKADAEMKEKYEQCLTRNFGPNKTVTADGIKEAQQAWLPYRDAWVKFGTAKYPKVNATAWRAWVTQQRTAVLQKNLY